MFSDLSKNTPEDLLKIRRYFVYAGVLVKNIEMDHLNECIEMIDECLKDAEFKKNELPFKQE